MPLSLGSFLLFLHAVGPLALFLQGEAFLGGSTIDGSTRTLGSRVGQVPSSSAVHPVQVPHLPASLPVGLWLLTSW